LKRFIGYIRKTGLATANGHTYLCDIDTIMDSKYLGKKVVQPIEELDFFPAPEGIDSIILTSDEVASSCPITGQPDFYTVEIEYRPNERCIESKSLKLYLWRFAKTPVFAEKLAVEIRDRVVRDIIPMTCRVTTIQKPRGGISIETVAQYPNSE
tara:strand:+ start:3708 stop:4169 length:462 start_codon:yes stop_codon:yes gene_type:complete